MMFEFLDLKPRNPFLSVALEESISEYLGRYPHQGYVAGVRLWSNPPAVVFGRTCRPGENTFYQNRSLMLSQKKSNWNRAPVLLRRASGGGTVLHGPGNLNYSIFLSLDAYPEMFELKRSYQTLLGIVARALSVQGIAVQLEGQSDLILENGKKISGNAQFRKHGVLVLHGTLITRAELIERISSMLKHPPKEPAYRQGRTHHEFLGSLPDSFDISTFYTCFVREVRQQFGIEYAGAIPGPDKRAIFARATRLVRDVYARPHWILDARIDRNGAGSAMSESYRRKQVLG